MTLCIDKGLCYHCDEKWIIGHRCQPRLYLIIVKPNADPSTLDPLLASPPPEPLPLIDLDPGSPPHISLHALAGTSTLNTFRLYDSIAHHRMVILIDSGSTHNFIQSHVTRFLNLCSTPTQALQVIVGNGSTLGCDTTSLSVPLKL